MADEKPKPKTPPLIRGLHGVVSLMFFCFAASFGWSAYSRAESPFLAIVFAANGVVILQSCWGPRPARITMTTAYGQGVKNVLVLVVPWLLGGLAISFASGKPFSESCAIAFAAMLELAFLWFFGAVLYGRSSGGEVILDGGPHPQRTMLLMYAVAFLFLDVTGGRAASSISEVYAVGGAVLKITFALYLVVAATGRFQVRETGIRGYSGLMRWKKIGSHSWASDSTLLLRGKGGWFATCWALQVPPEHKQAFDELLQRHCPVKPPA